MEIINIQSELIDLQEWLNTFEADSNYDGLMEIFPAYNPGLAQRIPRPREPAILLPGPGCFGAGPGGILHSAAKLNLNTSSFVTYAQVNYVLYLKYPHTYIYLFILFSIY